MFETMRTLKMPKCQRHRDEVITHICTSPQCNGYRQLCPRCKVNDHAHHKLHISRDEALQDVQKQIENLFKGLKALRSKIIYKMDTNINRHEGLNQIQLHLSEIKKTINDKIDAFHLQLKKRYEKQIKDKLNELFMIVERSYEFLEEQKIKLHRDEKLKPFYINDLQHQLLFYESYFEQILERNVRKFKKGFEHDKVLKMIVYFQQNLSEVFTKETTMTEQDHAHFFYMENKCNFTQFKGSHHLRTIELGNDEEGKGWVPSIYLPQKECYYLIGDGKSQSNKIRRMQKNQPYSMKSLDSKLHTKRFNFSVCLLNDEIYIVGGENSKEGCLIKCQKFVPSEGKTYIISSLHQRSAQHTVCTYRDRYILKFGGTDCMQSILEVQPSRPFKALSPQIYCTETEEWRILQIPEKNTLKEKINFGLWPGIFSVDPDTMIILQGETDEETKTRYDLTIQRTIKQNIKDIKMSKSPNRLYIKGGILNGAYSKEDNKIFFIKKEDRQQQNLLIKQG